MMMPPSNILIMLLAVSAPGGLGVMLWSRRRSTLLRLRAVMGETLDMTSPQTGLVHVLRRLGSNIPGASDESLRRALAGAGYFQHAALPAFAALRLLCTGLVFFLALLRGGTARPATLLLAVFLAFFCSRLFVVLLKLAAETRQRAVRRELPPVVDVLLMVLNSGVSIDQCLRYVTGLLEQAAPITSIVFKRYIADVDSGMSYEAAFERMGQRLGVDEGHDLASLIKQALLQGGEIMTSLEHFSTELTDKRVATAREQIGRKSVLLTLVMLVFFMPVLMITLAGPAVSNITDTLATVKQNMQSRGAR
jgi:tight adherence protein C